MKTASSLVLAALATSVAAPAAFALEFGNGFSLTGDIQLEYMTDGDGDETLGFADLTLGWRSQGNGGLGFGIDLGLDHLRSFDSGEHFTTNRASLVLVTSYGELAIGNPKAVLRDVLDFPEIGGSKLTDLELSFFTGSVLDTLIILGDADVKGMTFKGSSGDLGYGLGYHDVDFMAGAKVYEAAVTYAMGQTTLLAAVERLDATGGGGFTKLMLGAEYMADRWSAGALVTHASQTGGDGSMVMVYGDYSVTEAFKVGLQALNIDTSGPTDRIFGITTEYGFGEGGYAGLGYMNSNGSFGEDALTASVGYRF